MCPNCKQNTFSTWEKVTVAYLNPKKCKNCNAKVRPKFLPFLLSSLLAQIFMIFSVFWALKLISPFILEFTWSLVGAIVLPIIITSLIWAKLHSIFVPLVVVES